MFTVKDLEVYKDAIKEKKNRATITGEKPLKTPPSVAKISKPPLKLQNEEPNKERKPLSVVHKASNTIKDPPHKPPSPTPVGTSKLTYPGIKTKEITSRSPPPGNLHPIEANSLAKASYIKSESLKSPQETSLPKPTYIKLDDNKIVGVRKLKEPTTHGATNGVYQKSPSFSGVKVAPAANVNTSLCSECTRAASEGAVCFIGNDGRVSACTTRSAVRLCKNLNCAANNPEYVAAMANAPKKYLISKRHLLKAQFGLKSKSSRPKSPNSQQVGAAGINEWHHSLSPSTGDMSTANIDTSLNNFALESEDGELSHVNGSLRLFGDMSLLDGNDSFCEGEMGLMNDVMRDMTCVEDYATAEQGIAENRDDVNEKKQLSFHDGVVGETESPKFTTLESSKQHIEALSERSGGYNDANSHADAESFKLANSKELDGVDGYGRPIHRADMASSIGVSQVGDGKQVSDVVPTIDISRVPDDDQTGDQLEKNQVADDEQICGVTLAVDINQVSDDIISVINTNQPVHNYDKGGDLTPIEFSQVGDDGDSTSSISTHVERNNQSDGTDNNKDDGQSGDTKSLLIGHVADNTCGDDILLVNGGHAGDDILSVTNAPSGIITSSNGGHIADDDQNASLNDGHVADDDQCDDVTSPCSAYLMDGNVITSLDDTPHGKHVANNEEIGDTAFLHDKHVAEDGLSHAFTALNDRCIADDDESDEDVNEDDETAEIVKNIRVADNNSSISLQKGLESAEQNMGSGGEDGSVTSSSLKKVIKQRRRRILNVESSNPEMVTLRKQQTQERKQAEEWMLNYAIEGVVHKLAPTGEAKVKVLVEAFESIISHTDVEGSDTHNASKEKHTLA